VWNRGKRNGLVDPVDPGTTAAYERLLRTADVLVTNTAVDVGAAGGPHLVRLVTPPYLGGAPWPLAAESEGLLAAATGVSLSQASCSGGPVDAVVPILPTVHGVWAATAVVAALVERERSGLGQTVTVAGLHGVMVAASATLNVDPSASPPAPVGGSGGRVPFYRTYQCGDGSWLFLAALTPRFTDLAFGVLGLADIYDDPRLNGRGRAAILQPDNVAWVCQQIADVFRSDTRDEWLRRLRAVGCPAGPVLERDEWLDHPQLAAIGMRVELDDPQRGRVVMPGVPVTLHATPGRVRAAAPPTTTEPPAMWSGPPWVPRPATTGMAASTTPPAAGDGSGPLEGVSVLDLGAIVAGPLAGSLLGELGASVVKVEPPSGDSFRGPGFAAYNKGQRGVAIDLRHPKGREAFLALARTADIVIDNYRPGVLARLGLGWDALREVNPGIVSASITGFGDGGPLGAEAGFDPVLQAMSGMMAAQGGDAEPVFSTVPVNDVAAAAAIALGALLALLHRRRAGDGQKVTTSLAAMSAMVQAGEIVRFRGRPPARLGGRDHRGASAFDRYYEASDGWIRMLAPATGETRANLRRLGVEAAEDGAIARWAAARSRADAVAGLLQVGIAAVAARQARELVEDETITANDVLRPDARPGREGRWTTGSYGRFSRTPLGVTAPAPALGEHTIDVLTEAGYTRAEVDELERIAAVVTASDPRPGGSAP
jgi:crotonobetainyl-CoA:carnitine CoA-transferase CaiB-like acyl-CoA transferase